MLCIPMYVSTVEAHRLDLLGCRKLLLCDISTPVRDSHGQGAWNCYVDLV